MKNILTKILLVVILVTSNLFIGCKKDDTTIKNPVTFNSSIYSLTNGYSKFSVKITKTAPKMSVYKYDIIFVDSGLKYEEENENFSGQGNFIFLSMYSLEQDFLSPGIYTFDRFTSRDSLTIDDGYIGVNDFFDYGFSDNVSIISNGVVEVEKRGDDYEINFEFYTTADEKLEGSYSGLLEDYSIEYGKGTGKLNLLEIDNSLDHGRLVVNYLVKDFKGYAYTLELYGSGSADLLGNNKYSCTIFSPLRGKLATGKYTLNDSKNLFTFDMGAWSIQYTEVTFPTNSWFGYTDSGTIDVTRDGNKYTITLDLMVSNSVIGEKSLKGQYSGYLEYRNW